MYVGEWGELRGSIRLECPPGAAVACLGPISYPGGTHSELSEVMRVFPLNTLNNCYVNLVTKSCLTLL